MRIPQRLRDIDLRITAYLRRNARAQLTTVAQATNLPVSTVHDRLKVIHEKLIKRQVTHLNFPLLGYVLRCYTALRVSPGDRHAVQHYLEHHPNLNSLFHINNSYDFLMETYFPNVADFEHFLRTLAERFRIKHQQAFYIIDEIAVEKFLSNPALFHLLELQVP